MTHRWGIIGTGNIASQMAEALTTINNATIVAVCSRTIKRAKQFKTKHQVSKAYGSLVEFLNDSEMDHVYVATPHIKHAEEVIACLNAGKNVLCEKPMGVNSSQVSAMLAAAEKSGKLLMEGMWTQCFPAIKKMHQLISDGTIGKVKQIKADFSFKGPWVPAGRHLNLELAGGALLDVGIYTLYFAHCIKKELPTEIQSTATIGVSGVDEQSAYQLKYADGSFAQLTSAVQTESTMDALVVGTDGHISLPLFWQPDTIYLHKNGKTEKYEYERGGNGFNFEIEEFHHCIEAGRTESEILTHKNTAEIVEMMDSIRKQWGLIYPMEK